MEFTVQQIADLLNGEIEGSASALINNIAKIEEAGEGCIAFLSNLKYEPYLYSTSATAVIIPKNLKLKKDVTSALIRVEDPYSSFTFLLEQYQNLVSNSKTGVEAPNFVADSSSIGDNHYLGAFSYIGNNSKVGNNVKIYPHAYIGDNVTIGNNVKIYAGAKIYSNTVIGNFCTIHAGAVIGSHGFGFAPQSDGTYKDIPQLGNVILEDNVNIGANTTIDCATLGSTIIKTGTKIDNLVQIAHNVVIGGNTVVAAQTGISGSTKIGENCVIAGQVGIVGHITIANKTTIGAQSGVSKTVNKEGTIIQGSPAFDYKQNLRAQSVFRKLPALQKQVDELSDKI